MHIHKRIFILIIHAPLECFSATEEKPTNTLNISNFSSTFLLWFKSIYVKQRESISGTHYKSPQCNAELFDTFLNLNFQHFEINYAFVSRYCILLLIHTTVSRHGLHYPLHTLPFKINNFSTPIPRETGPKSLCMPPTIISPPPHLFVFRLEPLLDYPLPYRFR